MHISCTCNCFGTGNKQVHPDTNVDDHAKALQHAEELLQANDGKAVTDHYSLEVDIGHGAFAKVVRCSHKLVHVQETGAKYACKIAPCIIGQQDRHNMIVKEIAIMRQIGRHPYTPSCHDAYKDATSYYIIMELCTGGELFDLIIHQEIDEKQTAQMMWCLMDFLAFMHSKGIMHRDLKPENILMSSKDKDATIRVADFGTADFCAPHQRLFDKFGTVLYVAPEVLGSAGHQCSCDIWSAGVIMYILLAGYPPFNGPNDTIILRQVKRGQYTFAGSSWDPISTEAKECIKSMLAFKPSKRATAAHLLQHSWFKQARAVRDKATAQALLLGLSIFATMSEPQRLAFFLLAYTLADKETRHFKELFWHMDRDQDSKTGLQDVQQTLAKGGIAVPPEEEVVDLFNAADVNHTSYIDFPKLAAVMIDKHHLGRFIFDQMTTLIVQGLTSRGEDILPNAFQQLDHDNDGYVSPEDLIAFSNLKGLPMDASMLQKLWSQCEHHSTGKMGLAEFKAILQGVTGSAVGRTQSMPKTLKAWTVAAGTQ